MVAIDDVNTKAEKDNKVLPMMAWSDIGEARKKALETEGKGGISMTSEEIYYFGEEGEYTFPISFDNESSKQNLSPDARALEMQQPRRILLHSDSECEGQIMGLSSRSREEVRTSALLCIIPFTSHNNAK